MNPKGFFITGVGTGVGKTYVSRGTSRALADRGLKVAALKPIETGCDPNPNDALALCDAVQNNKYAQWPGFFRSPFPLAPYSISLTSGIKPIDLSSLATATLAALEGSDIAIIEGAGGIMAPLAPKKTNAEFAQLIDIPLVIVAKDELGVLSYAISAVESCISRNLKIACIVMSRHNKQPNVSDMSQATNALVLRKWVTIPVFTFESVAERTEALAEQAQQSGLVDFLLSFR